MRPKNASSSTTPRRASTPSSSRSRPRRIPRPRALTLPSRCSKACSRSCARSRPKARRGRAKVSSFARLRLRVGEPVNLADLVAGAQADVRHQRVPAGRYRAGADGADDRGFSGGHPAGSGGGASVGVSGLAASLRPAVQRRARRLHRSDRRLDRPDAKPRHPDRSPEPEPVRSRRHRRHCRTLRAQPPGGQLLHLERIVLRACRFGRADSSSRRASVSPTRSPRRSKSGSASPPSSGGGRSGSRK